MPGEKKLYMAKSLEDLNAFVDVSLHGSAKQVCRSAEALIKSADSILRDGDEEKSYVLYMRFIYTVLHVHKMPAYKRDKSYYDNMLGKNMIDRAEKLSTKLSVSLGKRYMILREEEKEHVKLKQKGSNQLEKSDLVASVKDLRIEGDTPPLESVQKSTAITRVPSPNESKGSISSYKLYELLHDKCVTLVVMDARSSKDYAASHIKSSVCFNIPAEIIVPGLSALRLQERLPQSSMVCWTTRGSVDVVVLLDWSSSIEKPPLGTEIQTLKNAIYKWDINTPLKREPLVLSGGYESWLHYYPMCSTDPHVHRPKEDLDLSVDSIMLDFEYPDLDNAFMETPKNSPEDFQLKAAINKAVFSSNGDIMTPIDIAPIKFKSPNVDRTTKPKVDLMGINIPLIDQLESCEKPSAENKSFKSSSKDFLKPSFDRNIKPKITTVDDAEVVRNHVIWNREVTDAGVHVEKERLKYELEMKTLRLQREVEAEESMKLILQKKEAVLLEKIDQIEEEHRKIGADRDAVREENALLKLKIDELTMQSNQQAIETQNEIALIKSREKERLKLESEVHKSRLERKLKEGLLNGNAEDVQPTLMPSATLSNTFKSSARPMDFNESTKTGFGAATDIGFERLNDEVGQSRRESFANRGLSRSQSYPNLSQVLENDVSSSDDVGDNRSTSDSTKSGLSEFSTPLVNRGVKPSRAELSAASDRNLMPVFGGQGRALTGLRNMGNTCYMNSVIQCLSNTRELANYFITRHYKEDINRNNAYGHPGILVEEFAVIVQALYNGQYRCVTPRDFKRIVSKYQKLFEGSEQQDAQELLTFLMEYLHEDLNRANKKMAKALHNEMKSLEDSTLPIETIGQKYWEFENQLNNSIFVELFQGQFKSTVICCYCHKESVKFDTFSCISLPIPSGRGHCNLRDCLQLFRKEEKMTGSSKWKCPRCKELREAIKKIDIYRLPHILLIHLKRFFYEGVWRRKLETHIDFPLTALDMRDYVVGPKDRLQFNLFAVTNHYGTLDGGHYTAFCKNVLYKKWFKFDDHEVNEISSSNVQSPAAYILYYTS